MYYLMEVTTPKNGTAAKAVWEKSDYNEALMAWHQTFASGIANQGIKSVLCMIVAENGAVVQPGYWERTDVSE